MRRTAISFFIRHCCKVLPMALALFTLMAARSVWGSFGDNVEKPTPEFTRQGDIVTAKLIPRAKSTSVSLKFRVTGGKLLDVEAMDFEQAERPEVDVKNFKSALFVIHIGDVTPGDEVKISISSDFFISSTQFYVFNANLPKPWMISEAENISLANRVQELVIPAKDGGPFDTDGSINGRITMVGGPRDSFWGYALGTLFIRFFGIFIVLCILMLGMILSGRVFQLMESNKARLDANKAQKLVLEGKAEEPAGKKEEIDPETAAAIAVALHLHYCGSHSSEPVQLFLARPTTWTQQGREQIMGERFLTFNRGKH